MIDDIKLIERMDKLIELGEDPNYAAEQNLMYVMGACRGIQRNAERRIEEHEKAYAHRHCIESDIAEWREHAAF